MKLLFTINFGGYDVIKTVPNWKGYDTILITDGEGDERFDDVIRVETTNPYLDSRYYKWMSHEWASEYESAIYFDANLELLKQPPVDNFHIVHQERISVKEEIQALIKHNQRYQKDSLIEQWNWMESEGFKDDRGLYLNGFFGRPHNEKYNLIGDQVYKICEEWTNRDMLALPFVLYKHNLTLDNLVPRRFFNDHLNRPPHTKMHPILR